MNRDFKGIWIPREIWLSEELTVLEKFILAEIDSLDTEEHCMATNEYLANFCGCSERKVSDAITKLIKLGYIEKLDIGTNQRVLKSNQGRKICYPATQNFLPPDPNTINSISINNNIDTISNHNNKTNNLSINNNVLEDNTIILSGDNIITEDDFEGHAYTEDFLGSAKKKKTRGKSLYAKCMDAINEFTDIAEIKDALVEYLNFRISVKDKPLYSIAQWKSMLKKLDTVVEETKIEYAIIVRQSLDRAWLNFYSPVKSNKKDVFAEGDGLSCEQAKETEEERRRILEQEGKRTDF